ncbi:MAG: phytoene desaturase family protein [Nitrososphaerales archaeon]
MADAAVVGSGPNGLAAGVKLAQAGVSTVIYESSETIGGGTRSKELTLPGFIHDVCSAVHPLAVASPFFQSLPLAKHGLNWIKPNIQLANPLGDGTCAVVYESLEKTAAGLENARDKERYSDLLAEHVRYSREMLYNFLGPLPRIPKRPLELLSFLARAAVPVYSFASSTFKGRDIHALLGGLAAHSMLRLTEPLTNGFAIVMLILAHAVGWPFPQGGSQRIADALASHFRSLGGEIITGFQVKSSRNLPRARATLFDLTPRQILRIFGGTAFPKWYAKSLQSFSYGPGVFKLDYALSEPIPWKSEECRSAGTVHVCGDLKDIVLSEQSVWEGIEPVRPFVIVAQQSLFDRSRAPDAKQTAWAYCHVPSGSPVDMRNRIENQIERFAPGFRKTILAVHSFKPDELEQYNANYVGGDINGGVQNIWQTISRPTLSICPYRTPLKGIYLCSSSTPPGGGVHGMCGYYAAKASISKEFSQ